jgi:hypothetical protein
MTDFKATPEQWEEEQKWVKQCSAAACLLELRARVEALEEAENDRRFRECSAAIDNAKSAPNLKQIRSSLVERVASAIAEAEHLCDAEDALPEARAAIREVAAWLREREGDYSVIRWLEQEAGQ